MLIKKHNNTQRETCAYSTALGCKALKCFVCASRMCSFYKTPQKELNDVIKANKRIASLSESEQAEIADKYYYSFMPWKEKE